MTAPARHDVHRHVAVNFEQTEPGGPLQLRPMLTFRGVASIAELIAAVCLAVALAGFAKWRVASWLVCGAAAAVALVVAALVVIGQSS